MKHDKSGEKRKQPNGSFSRKEVEMSRKLLLSLFIVMIVLSLASCEWRRVTPTPGAGLPNPASVYCEENGGKLDIRTDASGAQSGVCVFPNGSECDEWAYYRKECAPATETPAP
jgi:inhibitor of cysteine peptidase